MFQKHFQFLFEYYYFFKAFPNEMIKNYPDPIKNEEVQRFALYIIPCFFSRKTDERNPRTEIGC